MKYTYTNSEFTAFQILRQWNSNQYVDLHECGNEIILLAEKIKAERSVIAMGENK
jgi:hypothetical protein